MVYAFFVFEIICCTFLQKVAVPLNISLRGATVNLGAVEVVLPLTYIAMTVLFAIRPPRIDIIRLGLFVSFISFAIISTVQVNATYSPASIALAVSLALPLIFEIEISEHTYRRMLKFYLNTMLLLGIIVILQWISQLLFTWKSWPDFDQIIPENLQYAGYVYIQPIKYGSRLMKPNAEFLLEVSYVSQWTAVALAIELIYFRRFLRMIFYAFILLSTFAGTGLLLLAVSAPVLLFRMSWKSILGVAVIVAVCVIAAIQINWYQQVNQRFTEYKQTGASANHRFVEPLDKLVEVMGRKNSLFIGEGPGNIPKLGQKIWWAVTKIADEYGIITAVAYLFLFGYVLFKNAPSQRLALVLYVLLNFMGGFGIPVYPIFIFVLGGLFRIREGSAKKLPTSDRPHWRSPIAGVSA